LQWLSEQELNFDAIVFDELTRLKNPSGARFKALNKVIDKMGVRWGLTGSFTSNGLEDVFGQCKIVDQKLLGRSKGAFMQQYFVLMNPEYGEWMPRPGSLKRVMDVIRPATYVLEPGEYADKLPPCHMVEMRCDMVMTEYNTMKKDFVVQFGESQIAAINAAVVTGKLQQMASGFVYDTTSVASDAPGKFAVTQTPIWFSKHKFDALDDLLQENQRANTIIAYNYREELAELKRRYKHAVTLDDDRAIERWNAGQIEILLVHPKSAGHGLNLQHGGSKLAFVPKFTQFILSKNPKLFIRYAFSFSPYSIGSPFFNVQYLFTISSFVNLAFLPLQSLISESIVSNLHVLVNFSPLISIVTVSSIVFVLSISP
jgi:hypothetical protein